MKDDDRKHHSRNLIAEIAKAARIPEKSAKKVLEIAIRGILESMLGDIPLGGGHITVEDVISPPPPKSKTSSGNKMSKSAKKPGNAKARKPKAKVRDAMPPPPPVER